MDRTRLPGTWYRVDVRLGAPGEDQAVALAGIHGSLGVEVRPAGPGRIEVEAWFATLPAAEACLARWQGLEGAETGAEPQARQDEGWLEQSLEPREPLVVGPFLLVDGCEPVAGPDGSLLQLRIPRGRAFGTGEHETTRLCLECIGALDLDGCRVLDLGTGSAVLAIAAALRGAEVLALDNDPSVLEVAEENVALNGVAERVRVVAGSWGRADGEGPFDLVVANIHRSACERAARGLGGRLAPGASVVLSGFMASECRRVAQAWRAVGLEGPECRTAGEWGALRMWRKT
ncbi:MAG: 50S ribosomal protein L11 methyltransferase [Acidobacteriota bacterium]|nr:50S ribosomal protein L11 methyltransferase [Acidobacteriota bacterium]